MIKRVPHRFDFWCAAFFVCVSGCSVPSPAPPLSRAEAVRIADAEARKQVALQLYEHWPVWHKDGRWYVGYRQHGKKFVDFGIDVYDKTRKAWPIVFD